MGAHVQDCGLIGIMETWWDGSYDWSGGIKGHGLFGKDRQRTQGEHVVLCVKDQLKCMDSTWGCIRS